jgi:hypothetical protein
VSDDAGESVDLITVEPRVVYGWEPAEIGLFIPYRRVSVDDPFFGDSLDEDGIGDIRLYGKGMLRSDWVDVGFGLELTFPSGDEDKGLGAGEVGFLPFGTGAVHLGPVDLRAHAGYLAYADQETRIFGVDVPPNLIVYGGGLFWGINDYVAARAEFLGETTDSDAPDASAVVFEPGIDVRIPLGAVDLLIRPTGAVGLTDAAFDWGVGGGIAVNWNPQPLPPAQP